MKPQLCALLLVVVALCLSEAAFQPREIVPGSYLVTMHPGQSPSKVAKELGFSDFRKIGPAGTHIYLFSHGDKSRSSVRRHVDSLISHSAISFVEPDHIVGLQIKQAFNDPTFDTFWHLNKLNTDDLDINVRPVWQRGNIGEGIIVGIVDSGIFQTGSDLATNVDASVSINLADNSANWQPDTPVAPSTFDHGTFVGSTVAGLANNSFCGVGVAYGATIGALRWTSDLASTVINSLGFQTNKIWIKNYSLGFPGCKATRQCQLDGISQTMIDALEGTITNGRDGKGMINVWAASNEGNEGGDTNMSGFTASRCNLAVAATGPDGVQSSYSNFGAGVHISAPGGAGATNPLKGSSLLDTGSAGCTEGSGTSFAAPIVSGVVALMLKQNANLGWRDVKEILAKSAVKNDPTEADWTTNGAGLNINHKYGFGYVNADAAVTMAASWVNLPAEKKVSASSTTAVTIPAGQNVTTPINIDSSLSVEHVQITLTITGGNPSMFNIVLQSPAGTRSVLITGDASLGSTTFDNWIMLTVRNWGETAKGTWNLVIHNQDETMGDANLTAYTLVVYGHGSSGSSSSAASRLSSFLF